jgi:hypothetical protein
MSRAREWTAEITSGLYAWFAYNPEWGTFATSNIDHARMFESEADVLAWIQRLKVQGAEPVKVRAGKPVRPMAGIRRV